MRPLRTIRQLFAVLICALTIGVAASAQSVDAESARKHAVHSLNRIDAWLGDSPVAPSWRRFLNVEDLRTNLASQAAIDRDLLVETVARLRSGAQGLEARNFQRFSADLVQLMASHGISEQEILLASIRQQSDRFRPANDNGIAQVQRELAESLQELENYLSRGSESDESHWKEYLEWELLQQQSRVSNPDANILGRIAFTKLRAGHLGLERPSFVRVRKAIERLRLVALGRSSNEAITNAYAAELNNLINLLENAGSTPSVETSSKINQSVHTLETLGFPTNLGHAIRKRYLFPNLRLVASQTVIAKRFTAPVSNSQPVSETILGTHFTGQSHTTGTATARLIPARDHAHFEIVFQGNTVSNTRGVRHPIRLSTRSRTAATARMDVSLDGGGFSQKPSRARCSTRTRVRWIQAIRQGIGSRLVEKIAWRKVGEQKPLAQRLASRKAERRISQMMDKQVRDVLAQLNDRFNNRFRPRLSQRNAYPRWVHFSTTTEALFIEALQGQDDQLGSPTAPPAMPWHEFSIQVHESMPVNSAVSLLSGLNLDNEMAAELAEQLTGNVPADLVAADDGGWQIQFDFENPVVLSFRDNLLRVGITGRRFTGAKGTLDERMEISAAYEILKVDGTYVLKRSPQIDVSFPARPDQQLGIRDVAQKELIQKIFASVFEEELSADSLQLPEDFKGLDGLKLRYISSEDGWLSLGWK